MYFAQALFRLTDEAFREVCARKNRKDRTAQSCRRHERESEGASMLTSLASVPGSTGILPVWRSAQKRQAGCLRSQAVLNSRLSPSAKKRPALRGFFSSLRPKPASNLGQDLSQDPNLIVLTRKSLIASFFVWRGVSSLAHKNQRGSRERLRNF